MIQSNWHHEVPYLLALTDSKSGLHLKKLVFLNIINSKLSCFLQIEFFSITYHPQNQVKNQRPDYYYKNIIMVTLSQTGCPSRSASCLHQRPEVNVYGQIEEQDKYMGYFLKDSPAINCSISGFLSPKQSPCIQTPSVAFFTMNRSSFPLTPCELSAPTVSFQKALPF